MLNRIVFGRPFWRNFAPNSFRRNTSGVQNLDLIKSNKENADHSHQSKNRQRIRVFINGTLTGTIAAFGLWALKQFWGSNYQFLEAAQVIPGDDISKDRKQSRRKQYNFVADVIKEVEGSLVYIKIKDRGYRDYYTGEPTVVSNGSGFIVAKDGLILTNAHVVEGRPRALIEIQLQDGRTFPGQVEDLDRDSDLATVRIRCKEPLPIMKLGTSSDILPGEFVIAMGSPLALSNTITTGVVSAVARDKKELGIRNRKVPEYIQTDATITFGNSGGPLINLDGEAIGVNSMKMTPGISFAIPIDHAKQFLDKSKQKKQGKVQRRYMGIKMLAITPQIIDELRYRINLPHDVAHGIVVYQVVQDSPADNAGIRPGDIITRINGNLIYNCSEITAMLEAEGDLKVNLMRGTQHIQVSVMPDT